MRHAIAYSDLIAPVDRHAEAIDAEAEAIGMDQDRRWEAVSCGDPEDLTELRLALADASYLLGQIAQGYTLDQITSRPARRCDVDAFRKLIRAADACDALVQSRVKDAAETAVEARH